MRDESVPWRADGAVVKLRAGHDDLQWLFERGLRRACPPHQLTNSPTHHIISLRTIPRSMHTTRLRKPCVNAFQPIQRSPGRERPPNPMDKNLSRPSQLPPNPTNLHNPAKQLDADTPTVPY